MERIVPTGVVRAVAALAVAFAALPCPSVAAGPARNVILLVGDGMADAEITAARNYHVGAGGRLRMDGFVVTGAMTTHAVREDDPARPDYVTDSAASATAWTTGHKTSNGRLATLPKSGVPVPTLAEIARAHGLAVGNVTTAEVTDATPAALGAHVNSRRCQGPADMDPCPAFRKTQGGAGSIAEQLLDREFAVLLGGGRQRFAQPLEGATDGPPNLLEAARQRGYAVVTDGAGMRAAPAEARVLGLFADAEMAPDWLGEPAKPHPGSGPQRCREGQRPAVQPGLAEMTRFALERLEQRQRGKPEGFVLQVEAALIDKAAHVANPCAQIGETIALDAAVGVALEFAAAHPATLVIVFGDHGHSTQILPVPDAREGRSPGLVSTLLTADGVPMMVSYATNAATGGYQQHTGTQVRIAAQGPLAERVRGVIDNTDVFALVLDALGLPRPPRPADPAPAS